MIINKIQKYLNVFAFRTLGYPNSNGTGQDGSKVSTCYVLAVASVAYWQRNNNDTAWHMSVYSCTPRTAHVEMEVWKNFNKFPYEIFSKFPFPECVKKYFSLFIFTI